MPAIQLPEVDIPKPLLILVLVVVILGVVSCGVGVARNVVDQLGVQYAQQLHLGGTCVRPPSPTLGPGATPPVSIAVSIPGSCSVTLRGSGLGTRKLEFVPAQPVRIAVSIEISGRVTTSDDTLGAGELADVTSTGSNEVQVGFSCLLLPPCQVELRLAPD